MNFNKSKYFIEKSTKKLPLLLFYQKTTIKIAVF